MSDEALVKPWKHDPSCDCGICAYCNGQEDCYGNLLGVGERVDNEESNQIVAYLHCAQCLGELPEGESPAEYARTQTGLTNDGRLQIWCNRHGVNVALINSVEELAARVGGHSCEAYSNQPTIPVKSYGREVH